MITGAAYWRGLTRGKIPNDQLDIIIKNNNFISDIIIYTFFVSLGLPFFVNVVKTDDYFLFPKGSILMRFFILWHLVNSVVPTAFLLHMASLIVSFKNKKTWVELRNPGFGAGLTAIMVVFLKEAGLIALWSTYALDKCDGSLKDFIHQFYEIQWIQYFSESYYQLHTEIGNCVVCAWLIGYSSGIYKFNLKFNNIVSLSLGFFWIMLMPLSWYSSAFD